MELYFILVCSVYLLCSTVDASFKRYPEESTNAPIESKLILHDEKYNRIYFSGINALYSSSLDLSNVEKYDLKPSDDDMNSCKESAKTHANTLCNNNIKILKYDFKDNVFVCGTNSLSPKCWCFNRTTNGLELIKTTTGVNRSPSFLKDNASIVFSEPFYFVATKGRKYNAIRKFRLTQSSVLVKTSEQEDTVFKNPHFVSAHAFDGTNYTYFFFYESSIENPKRESILSRVGRVCKHDAGPEKLYTFLKAQLTCFKKGEDFNMYYDRLYATKLVQIPMPNSEKVESYVYGLFGTLDGRGGSALCRYKVDDIITLFETSELYVKDDKTSSWIKKPFSADRTILSRPKCESEVKANPFKMASAIGDAMKMPLLFENVIPFGGEALWTHPTKSLISFDMTEFHMYDDLSDIGIHVILFGSQHGEVLKIQVNTSGKGDPTIIETLKPFKSNQPIYDVSVNKDKVYAASDGGISAFDMERCSNQRVCAGCVGIRDPFCAWSISKKKCVPSKSFDNVNDRVMDLKTGKPDNCPIAKTYFSCNITTLQHVVASTILRCTASSNESTVQPNIIAWNFNSQPLLEDTENGVTFLPQTPTSEQTLKVIDTQQSNSGFYECIIQLDDETKRCSVTIDVAVKTTVTTTTTSTATSTKNVINNSTVHTTRKTPSSLIQSSSPVSTEKKTTPSTTTVSVLPVKKSGANYLEAFIAMLIVCIILFIILILVCLCRYKKQRENNTETDGKQNGHAPNGHIVFKVPFSKKYKMNRKDSANKELIKKKNKSQVYKDTTLEMNETEEKTPV